LEKSTGIIFDKIYEMLEPEKRSNTYFSEAAISGLSIQFAC
jgi:hypothetical protein